MTLALAVLVAAPAGAADPVPSFAFAFGAGTQPTCTTACQPGTPGPGAEQFSDPVGVAPSVTGGLLVAERANRRIAVLDANGAFVRAFGAAVGGPGAGTCTTACSAGAAGDGAGELAAPSAVARAGGEVFVADPGNRRISVFSEAGAFLRAFGDAVDPGTDATPGVCTTACRAGQGGSAAGQLDDPEGVAVADGEVFVADAASGRVEVFGVDGTFRRAFGTAGGGPGGLIEPTGIAASGGELFVADRAAARVAVFTPEGVFVRAFGAGVGEDGAAVCSNVCSRGVDGGGAGQLDGPAGLTVAAGHVFVSESRNHRISTFTLGGLFVRAAGAGVDAGDANADVCSTDTGCEAGTPGGAAAQLDTPAGIAVVGGTLWAADGGNQRLSAFMADGPFVRVVGRDVDTAPFTCTTACRGGSAGAAPGQFAVPTGVAATQEAVFTADRINRRVNVTTPAGAFVRAFGLDVGPAGFDVCTAACRAGTGGGEAGALAAPAGVAAASGEIYVADPANARVSVFDAAGTFLRAFGSGVDADETPGVCATTCGPGADGDDDGALHAPMGVAVSDSEVFVVEQDASRISVFATDGDFLRTFGGPGAESGELTRPTAIAVAGAEVLVADAGNRRVSVFSIDGSFQRAFGNDVNASNDGDADICTTACAAGADGGDAGALADASGIAVALGEVFVSDRSGARISQFTVAGDFVRAFGKKVDPAGDDECTSTCRAGFSDASAGSLASPAGLATIGAQLVVADAGHRRMSVFDVPKTGLRADPEAVDVGIVDVAAGAGPTRTARLVNSGNTRVTLTALTLGGADGDAFERLAGEPGDCAIGTVLEAGESCPLRVRFDPSASGTHVGTMTAGSNAPDVTLFLSANGKQAPTDGVVEGPPSGPLRPVEPPAPVPPPITPPTGPPPAVFPAPIETLTRQRAARLQVRRKTVRIVTGYVAACPADGPPCRVFAEVHAKVRGALGLTVALAPRLEARVPAGARRAVTFTITPKFRSRLPRRGAFTATLRGAIRAGERSSKVRTAKLRLQALPRR